MEESAINFEDSKWNTFHRQFKAYQKQHPRSLIKTLPDFAKNVLEYPHHYQERTQKRAESYRKTLEKKGGKLAIGEVKDLVKSSYEKSNKDLKDFDVDHELSGDKVKVYKRKGNSKQAVVVHRGTNDLSDLALDVQYVLGKDISKSSRAKKAKEIQEKAEAKYGKENTSTVGHSLGSTLSSLVGNNSHEIINVNKAVAPQDFFQPISDKETNIRTKYDPVSALLALKGHKNTLTIPSTSIHPLEEHSTDTLDRIDSAKQVGRGRRKKILSPESI